MKIMLLFSLLTLPAFADVVINQGLKPEDQSSFKNSSQDGLGKQDRIDNNVKEINKLHKEIASLKAEIESIKDELASLKKQK